MPTYTSFKQLDCWQKSRDVKVWINEFLEELPKREFDIRDNMIRAARSSTRNIAEGFGRYHFKENIQFCRISRGSLFELLDDLDNCVLEKHVSKERIAEGEEKIKTAIQSINGYMNYLDRKFNRKT